MHTLGCWSDGESLKLLLGNGEADDGRTKRRA
jgi:hypothetical protein